MVFDETARIVAKVESTVRLFPIRVPHSALNSAGEPYRGRSVLRLSAIPPALTQGAPYRQLLGRLIEMLLGSSISEVITVSSRSSPMRAGDCLDGKSRSVSRRFDAPRQSQSSPLVSKLMGVDYEYGSLGIAHYTKSKI